MSNNFEKFNNGDGENEKEYTEEEIEEAFYHIFLNFNMELVTSLDTSPEYKNLEEWFKNTLKILYDKFVKELIEYFEKNKKITTFFSYFENRHPNNLWLRFVQNSIQREKGIDLFYSNPDELIKILREDKHIRDFIERKRKGMHIQ